MLQLAKAQRTTNTSANNEPVVANKDDANNNNDDDNDNNNNKSNLGNDGQAEGGAAAVYDSNLASAKIQETAERLTNVSINSIERFGGDYFAKEARILEQIAHTDCHLRNLDLCYSGLVGTMQKLLPETNAELESRCDEMKASFQCMLFWTNKCNSERVIGYLTQFSPQANAAAGLVDDIQLPDSVNQIMNNDNNASLDDVWRTLNETNPQLTQQLTGSGPADLSRVCNPTFKNSKQVVLLRHKLFKQAKCINSKVPLIAPCVDDLKNAIQLIHDLNGKLPVMATCCAISRFRHCATNAMDNVCELGSAKQLEASLGRGPIGSIMGSLGRVCRQASDHESAFCKSSLPPPGMKAPLRRGRKSSKIAKLLEMVQFSPSASKDAMSASN